MKLEQKGIIKELRKLSPTFNNNSLRRKIKTTVAGKILQAVGRTGKGKGVEKNDKKMLEMEEQLKETKKNRTFSPQMLHVAGNAAPPETTANHHSNSPFNGPEKERR